MTNGLDQLVHWSAHHKLNRVSSVQFSYFALYVPSVKKNAASIFRSASNVR